MGTGRRWAEASGELRFPLLDPLSGALFVDWGSDLDSGAAVLGDPAGESHFWAGPRATGDGGGARLQTPVVLGMPGVVSAAPVLLHVVCHALGGKRLGEEAS